MWGRDVLRELRKDPANRLTPVVIITADAYAERMEELWREGASRRATSLSRIASRRYSPLSTGGWHNDKMTVGGAALAAISLTD